MKTKTCKSCKENKTVDPDPEVSRFDKQRASKDGFRPMCKNCHMQHKKRVEHTKEVSPSELVHWNGIDSVYC